MPRIPLRWLALLVFVLASALNYLDRQLLAAVAPMIQSEFRMSNQSYGYVVSAFSLVYAASAPGVGLMLDQIGLRGGISISVALWSMASVFTAAVRNFTGLISTRSVLGLAEAAAIPGFGKANGTYLKPQELAIGTAVNQVGLTIGSIAAPLTVAWFAAPYGWRMPFVFCGALGFVWIPLWLFASRRVPEREEAPPRRSMPVREILADRRLWALMAGNAFAMVLYTLWTNWTTLYFVEARGLTQAGANRHFAWIPPVFATLGAFAGGWMAFRWIRAGVGVYKARMRVCWISSVIVLATAAVPLAPTPGWAAAIISLSFFWVTAMSTNIYVMPIDLYGAARAGFGVAAITFSFGAMQAFASPAIGSMIDHFGFAPVCACLAFTPLIATVVLRTARP